MPCVLPVLSIKLLSAVRYGGGDAGSVRIGFIATAPVVPPILATFADAMAQAADWPVRSVLLSRIFGVPKFSRANGLMTFFLAPATFWVLITGAVADASGTYVTAFQIWAVAFLLAALVTALIRLPNAESRSAEFAPG